MTGRSVKVRRFWVFAGCGSDGVGCRLTLRCWVMCGCCVWCEGKVESDGVSEENDSVCCTVMVTRLRNRVMVSLLILIKTVG